MARLVGDAIAVTRGAVMKMRQRVVMKPHRGSIVVQKWPKKRGPPKSSRQKAWVDRFRLLSCLIKNPPAQIYEGASEWTQGTGWFWRDLLFAAANGNAIEVIGEVKITTPTARTARTTDMALSAGTQVSVPWETETWDNNNFWALTPNPTRIRFLSPGLYLVGARAGFSGVSADGDALLTLRLNGTQDLLGVIGQDIANRVIALANVWLWYCNANDFVEVRVQSSQNRNLLDAECWVVAITPEAII